jgi:hypothetical protein
MPASPKDVGATMKHDESALVKQALREAREQLQARGRICPATYLLARNNPQTGAPLTNLTAIGSSREKPFATPQEFAEFLEQLRSEIARLDAVAVALCGEAEAEIETSSGGREPSKRRVWYVRIEDAQGIEQLHAAVEPDGKGGHKLGKLLADAGAVDMLDAPLLKR